MAGSGSGSRAASGPAGAGTGRPVVQQREQGRGKEEAWRLAQGEVGAAAGKGGKGAAAA